MRTFVKTLALLAAFAPGVALAQATQHRFTHEGVTYAYTVTATKTGRQVIEGRALPGGSAFRFVVSGDRVDGVVGGQPVAFRTPRATGVTVAAR